MSRREEKSGRFNMRNELMIAVLSAAFGFTLMLFSPLEVYAANPDAFMVELGMMIKPLLGASLVLTALLAGIMNLLLFISEDCCRAFSRGLLGLLLAFFVQAFVMNDRMPIVIKNDLRFERYRARITANAIIFVLVWLMPTAVHFLVRLFKSEKLRDRKTGVWVTTIIGSSLIIFGMASAGVKLSKVDLDKYKGVHRQYLSYEPAMSLSKEGNVVVFLTDRLDREWMDDLLEGYPELKTEFSGFTYYRNNVSTGTSTFPVVPSMLTNGSYSGEEWADFLSDSWSGETVPKLLKENGYNVYLIPDSITTLSSTSQVRGQCDNIREYDESDLTLDVFGKHGVIATMARLSAARMCPYALKHGITYWLGANFTRFFVQCRYREDSVNPQAGIDGDMKFYHYIKENGLRTDCKNKTFTFVHLNCAHTIADNISSIYGFHGTADVYTTARGDLEIVAEYIRKMKDEGIFENSTIIVLGDHGRAPRELQGRRVTLNDSITAALLIKPAGESGGSFSVDNDSELSIEFFPASILEYAGIDHTDRGYSYNDVIGSGISTARYLRGYDFKGYGRMIYQALYRILGDARNFDNWERIE